MSLELHRDRFGVLNINPKCPKCGEEELRATVEAWYKKVPLHRDGFDPSEGKVFETEIVDIECANCGATVPLEHYYSD